MAIEIIFMFSRTDFQSDLVTERLDVSNICQSLEAANQGSGSQKFLSLKFHLLSTRITTRINENLFQSILTSGQIVIKRNKNHFYFCLIHREKYSINDTIHNIRYYYSYYILIL